MREAKRENTRCGLRPMSDKAASQKTRSPEGCDENGPAAALLLSHVSIQICSFVAPCRRPILIATPLNQSRTLCTSLTQRFAVRGTVARAPDAPGLTPFHKKLELPPFSPLVGTSPPAPRAPSGNRLDRHGQGWRRSALDPHRGHRASPPPRRDSTPPRVTAPHAPAGRIARQSESSRWPRRWARQHARSRLPPAACMNQTGATTEPFPLKPFLPQSDRDPRVSGPALQARSGRPLARSAQRDAIPVTASAQGVPSLPAPVTTRPAAVPAGSLRPRDRTVCATHPTTWSIPR